MKLAPRRNQVLGRLAICRRASTIVLTDEKKGTSTFIYVDAVGPDAEAAGIKVGDMITPKAVPTAKGFTYLFASIITDAGLRALIEEPNIAAVVSDLNLDDFNVQTESASQYVPFDSDEAAKSLGKAPRQDNGHAAVAGAPV
jgi:hypothetical protein